MRVACWLPQEPSSRPPCSSSSTPWQSRPRRRNQDHRPSFCIPFAARQPAALGTMARKRDYKCKKQSHPGRSHDASTPHWLLIQFAITSRGVIDLLRVLLSCSHARPLTRSAWPSSNLRLHPEWTTPEAKPSRRVTRQTRRVTIMPHRVGLCTTVRPSDSAKRRTTVAIGQPGFPPTGGRNCKSRQGSARSENCVAQH